jgi:TRAP-type C4-dicarboxylate transport system permease small subunit
VTDPIAPDTARTAETASLMASRYGVPSRRRRWLGVAVVALLATALVVWVVWAAWHQATTTVDGNVSAFDIVGPHRVDVTVQIHRPSHAVVQCTVQAQATDHSVVGQTVVSLPRAGASDVQVKTAVKTEREATTVVVSQCR